LRAKRGNLVLKRSKHEKAC